MAVFQCLFAGKLSLDAVFVVDDVLVVQLVGVAVRLAVDVDIAEQMHHNTLLDWGSLAAGARGRGEGDGVEHVVSRLEALVVAVALTVAVVISCATWRARSSRVAFLDVAELAVRVVVVAHLVVALAVGVGSAAGAHALLALLAGVAVAVVAALGRRAREVVLAFGKCTVNLTIVISTALGLCALVVVVAGSAHAVLRAAVIVTAALEALAAGFVAVLVRLAVVVFHALAPPVNALKSMAVLIGAAFQVWALVVNTVSARITGRSVAAALVAIALAALFEVAVLVVLAVRVDLAVGRTDRPGQDALLPRVANRAVFVFHRAVDLLRPVASRSDRILVAHVKVQRSAVSHGSALVQAIRQVRLANPESATVVYMLNENRFSFVGFVDPLVALGSYRIVGKALALGGGNQ